ncbi:MAG: hypothetical protein ABIP53_10210 [Candidatus Limnocylindrales bacterium]
MALGSSSLASGGWGGKSGNSPTPFDSVDGHRLAGPQGSHPLAAVSIEELLTPRSGGLNGSIHIKHPIRIGEAIEGHISVTALKNISARTAMLRLVGAVISERQESREERDSQGRVIRSEQWVEVGGKLFEELPFGEPGLPAMMTAGQVVERDFVIPAPRLGPPSGHYGTGIIAWAVEARWDVQMHGDERLAAVVDVEQNIDYLRSGAVRLGEGALFDAFGTAEATIAVTPIPPIVAGTEIDVTVNWPAAGGGQGGRLELQADIEAPNGIRGLVLWSMQVDPNSFRSGLTMKVPVPADAPPSFSSQGIGVGYRIRALVDRRMRSDLAVERAIAVM